MESDRRGRIPIYSEALQVLIRLQDNQELREKKRIQEMIITTLQTIATFYNSKYFVMTKAKNQRPTSKKRTYQWLIIYLLCKI